MTTYLVTAASGHYGRLAVTALLDRGIAPERIRAGARDTGRLADLAALGVSAIRADYDDLASLDAAMAVPDGDPLHVLLVSGNEVGRRIAQHDAVVHAAARAGVRQLVYTSISRATTTDLVLAPEHKATEEILTASGVPTTILRHNWYVEELHPVGRAGGPDRLTPRKRGERDASRRPPVRTSPRPPRRSSPPRATSDGSTSWAGMSASRMRMSQRRWPRSPERPSPTPTFTPEEHHAALTGTGLDEGTAGFVVRLDQDIRRRDLDVDDHALSRLLGRPTTPFAHGAARRPRHPRAHGTRVTTRPPPYTGAVTATTDLPAIRCRDVVAALTGAEPTDTTPKPPLDGRLSCVQRTARPRDAG